jgi:hypothetical protein
MSPQRRLVLASVVFAVIWTAGMLWMQATTSAAGVVIMAIAGAIAGTLWYFAMRWFMNRYMRPRA